MKTTFVSLVTMTLWILGYSTSVWATPDASTWKRELLIGANDTHFYSYVIERENPSSYFEYTETLLLAKYAITTGQLAEKITIRKTLHLDKEGNNNWTTEEQLTTPFDLNHFLTENHVSYAFPNNIGDAQIVVKTEGFFLQDEKSQVVLLPKSKVVPQAPWFDQYTKIVSLYEINNNYYLLIEQRDEFGEISLDDMDFQQTIIIITGEAYKKAWDSLISQDKSNVTPVANPTPPNTIEDNSNISNQDKHWQVQVGCFKEQSGAEKMVQSLGRANFAAKINFSDKANCHRVILMPLQATPEAAQQQAQQLQEKLNFKGYVGKVE